MGLSPEAITAFGGGSFQLSRARGFGCMLPFFPHGVLVFRPTSPVRCRKKTFIFLFCVSCCVCVCAVLRVLCCVSCSVCVLCCVCCVVCRACVLCCVCVCVPVFLSYTALEDLKTWPLPLSLRFAQRGGRGRALRVGLRYAWSPRPLSGRRNASRAEAGLVNCK